MGILLPKDVDSIMIIHRAGTQNDPYVDIEQTLKVATNRVVLKEVPDEATKVTVSDGTSNLVESTSPKNLTEGSYFVDYRIGFVYFSDADNGKTFDFSFKGTGVLNMPASRIVLEDNQETEKTLQDYIDESDQHIQTANDAIDTMNTVVQETNEAKNQANQASQYAESQGDYAKSVGDNVKTNWLAPVVSFTDVENTYTSPTHGDTVMTTTDSKVYRYQNGQWDHTQTITDSGISDVQAELAEQDQQTANLHHGTQVIESDQSSPLKVEFYGNTLVNYLGKNGGFPSQTEGTGVVNGWNAIGTSDVTYSKVSLNGKIAQRIDKTTTSNRGIRKEISIPNGYYLIVAKMIGNDVTGSMSFNYTRKTQTINGTNTMWTKGEVTDGSLVIDLELAFETGMLDIYEASVYKIPSETYDKIGVSLDDSDVERLFPYVDSVQHVKNPVLKVSGKNLFDGQLEEGSLTSSGNVSGDRIRGVNYISVIGNQKYIFSQNIESFSKTVYYYDEDYNYINHGTSTDDKITTPSNCRYIRFRSYSKEYSTTDVQNLKIQLELGTVSTPYTDYNPSYLYAEVTLAGNSNEKDILRQSDGTWYVDRNHEIDYKLDGSRDWVFNADKTDYKIVRLPLPYTPVDYSGIVSKYDGSILSNIESGSFSNSDEQVVYDGAQNVYVTISDSDSGWDNAYKPNTDEIDAYFYSWKVNGYTTGTSVTDETTGSLSDAETYTLANAGRYRDVVVEKSTDDSTWEDAEEGTDYSLDISGDSAVLENISGGSLYFRIDYVHGTDANSWEDIVDGSDPETNDLDYVSSNQAPSNENYFLSYQLAEPVAENVDHLVEGSLKINGDAQVEVNSGGEYFESLSPDTTGQATLAHSASEVFGVYDGSAYIDFTVVDADNIQITNYDDTKSYTVNYMRQDKYNFTTNMNDVTVHYASSLKDSVDRNITQTNDLATENSILKRQMLEVLVRLDALEGGSN